MKEFLQKKPARTALIIVFVILVVFCCMLLTVKMRVTGVWQRELVYLPKYGCDSIVVVALNHDGTAQKILTNANTGAILSAENGYWDVIGFAARYRVPGESGYIQYDFNPITGGIKNGKHDYYKIG
ncbi:MAG: hypothetical protein IJ465_00860 [Clostridia bacterium]|nr:hypothetical protein [Clostridia bacterium]